MNYHHQLTTGEVALSFGWSPQVEEAAFNS